MKYETENIIQLLKVQNDKLDMIISLLQLAPNTFPPALQIKHKKKGKKHVSMDVALMLAKLLGRPDFVNYIKIT